MIPENTPLFIPSESARRSSYFKAEAKQTLLPEWLTYAASVGFGADRSQCLKDLFDYNLNQLAPSIELETLSVYSMLGILLHREYFGNDFIGARLSNLFDKTQKDTSTKNFVFNMLIFEMETNEELEFIFEKNNMDIYYSNKEWRLAYLIKEYIHNTDNLNNRITSLMNKVYDPLTIASISSNLVKDYKDTNLMYPIKLIGDENLITHFLDNTHSKHKLGNLLVLKLIIDLADKRELSSDSDILNATQQQTYKNSKRIIESAFEAAYPAEYNEYNLLSTLDLDPVSIWAQIKTKTGIIDAINLPDLTV